ncbi:phospholipase D-like domain-containing protein [Nocardioides marmoriginsengisoli]|uniref:phospholipase D-like domain-containing protein n=1 Tax=Nocardioides marmoriginsengisoli TaxID=661483 RepID=UPI00160E7AF5|nr:phospholipase D-like domain-containing protein [Nocardioides marmoriginsengisoli]
MLRTGTARRAGTVLTTIALLLAALVLSGLGAQAGAVEQPAAPDSSPAAAAVDEPDPGTVNKPTTGGPLTANPDNATIQAFSAKLVTVLANDVCNNATPCSRASLTAMTATNPPGWTVLVENGRLKVFVPSGTMAGYYQVPYTITDLSGSSSSYLRVRVTLPPTPGHYNPPQGSKFSHAFQRDANGRIKSHIIRTINSVPRGGQIRVMSWSFASPGYLKALVAAKNRGVSVQIVLAARNTRFNSDFGKLQKAFGGTRYKKHPLRGSWVYKCYRSCRGSGGTMHAKTFLFSQAYNTRWITMSGSGNFTDFAAQGQWNQLYTTTNDKAVYDAVLKVFMQMKYDRPQRPRQLTLNFPNTTYFFTPLYTFAPKADFVYNALRGVTCKGATTPGGRTKIRIAMYVWRDNRGDWMARQVRKLWNEGCDVRIIYAIMGNRNKAILYSPKGRGRIPMRQTLQVDEDHRPVWYLHQKYVAIGGRIGASTKDFQVYQGSFNFSDLGMRSDENMQRVQGYVNYKPYITDFNQVWRQRETRAPNPNSYVLQLERLGTGRYKYMEPN